MSKVLFFDIDGTLINPIKGISQISQTVLDEMKRLKDEGNYLFIASGRPKAFLPDDFLQAGFSGYILCNGAYIEINNQPIYEKTLHYGHLVELIQILEKYHFEYFLETSSYVCLDKRFKKLNETFQSFGIEKSKFKYDFDLNEELQRTLKLELHTIDHNGSMIEKFIKQHFSYDCHGTQDAYEIYSKTNSKATAIKHVLDYLNIPLENSYAFGDGLNDIEMIQYVGHGVAMENGCQQLKNVADDICESIEQDGLAKYLKAIK